MISEDKIKVLFEALVQTYTGNTNQIKAAENVLKDYENFVISDISQLLELLFENKLDLNLRKALVSFIKGTIVKKLEKFTIGKEKVLEIVSALVSSISIKQTQLELSISSQLFSLLLSLLNASIISNDPTIYIQLNISLIKTANEINLESIFSLMNVIISSSGAAIQNIEQICNDQLEFIQKHINNSTTNIQIIKIIIDLLVLTMKKLNTLSLLSNLVKKYSSLLCKRIYVIIFRLSSDNNIVTFITKQDTKDEIHKIKFFNSLKEKCFLLLSFFIQFSDKQEIKDDQLLPCINNLLPFVMKSLLLFSSQYATFSYEDKTNGNYDQIVYQLLVLISRCIIREPFSTQMQGFSIKFIFEIIFPLLNTFEEDKARINSAPEDYYSLLLDSMFDFKYKTIRTASGFLLGTICDKFSGIAFKVLNYITELTNFLLNETDINAIGNYISINNSYGNNLLKEFSPEVNIDISLLFICILAKKIVQKDEVKTMIKNFLLTNQNFLHQISSEVIQYKICLIYGLFLDGLFNEFTHTDFIQKAMEFLLTLILKGDTNQGLAYEALHSFNLIVELRKFNSTANILVRKRVDKFIEMIPTVEIDIFFDMVNILLTQLNLEDYTLSFLDKVVQRFKVDSEKSNLKCNVFILKELSIVRSVLEKMTFIPQMEKILQPILILFPKIKDIEFSDRMINILLAMTFKTERINPILFQEFPFLLDYVISKDAIDSGLFKLLNFILLYDDTNALNTNNELLNYFIRIIMTLFKLINEYIGQPSPIYTLLLIQIWISNQKNRIPQEKLICDLLVLLLDKIEEMCLIYKENFVDILITNDCYLLWGYLGVIYAFFMNYIQISLNIIMNRNILNKLIDLSTLLYKSSYYSCCIGKIVILGLCNMLFDNQSLQTVFTLLEKILTVLINMMQKQKKEEIAKGTMDTNLEIEQRFIDEDSEEELLEDQKEEEEENNDDKKMKEILLDANFPNQEIDEFEVFSKVISRLESFNETKETLINIIGNFDKEVKQEYINLIHTRRVSIQNEKESITLPRRIVKIKRNEN